MSVAALLLLSTPVFAEESAEVRELPRPAVSLSASSWGYREGFGARVELAPSVSLTSSLAPFRWNIGFVSNTGAELHPVHLTLGWAGWIVPTLGVGAFATGGIAGFHGDPQTGAGLYAAPGIRWMGPKGRASTLLGVTGRYQLQGDPALDSVALTLGFEYAIGKRHRKGRAPLPDFGEDLPE